MSGHGHAYRNHGHDPDDRLYAESSRGGCGVGGKRFGGVENGGDRDHDLNRSATMQMEVYAPTYKKVSRAPTPVHRLTYLDLKSFVAAYALVVHFVVGFIGIAAALVFNKSEAAYGKRGAYE